MEAQLRAQLTTGWYYHYHTRQILRTNLINDVVGLLGTTNQKRSADLKKRKRKALINKHKSYNRRAKDYNWRFQLVNPLPMPSLNEVEGMSITDVFWCGGALTHPDEPWASDEATRTGIQAYLSKRACDEELHRIATEVRQMLMWAVTYQAKVDLARPNPEGISYFLTSMIHILEEFLSTPLCLLHSRNC